MDNGNEDLLVQINRSKTERLRCPASLRMRVITGASIILVGILFGLTGSCLFRNPVALRYPAHASCNITWTLGEPCDDVTEKIVRQINLWKTNETCGSGQKCLYKLESIEGNILIATHTAPNTVQLHVYDLKFGFYPSTTGCHVTGFSTTRTQHTAILDSGTNYCNLHNLVEGAGLQGDKIYSELTKDEICTQYTAANCEKY